MTLSFALNNHQFVSLREATVVLHVFRDYQIVQCFGVLSMKLQCELWSDGMDISVFSALLCFHPSTCRPVDGYPNIPVPLYLQLVLSYEVVRTLRYTVQ